MGDAGVVGVGRVLEEGVLGVGRGDAGVEDEGGAGLRGYRLVG